MRTLLFVIICFFVTMNAFSQSINPLAKSDSLFAKGVELYKLQKYEDAIQLFKESDQIDKAILDSTSSRRDYSAMWLADCYKKIGLIHLSDSIFYPLFYKPVDRRLTVVSDSLADLAAKADSIQDKIFYTKECAKIEASVLGEAHQFRANSLSNLIFYQTLTADLEGVRNTFDEIYRISLTNKNLRLYNGLDFPFMYLINNSKNQEEYFAYLDKIIFITSLSKCDEGNTLWRYYIKDKINKLSMCGEYDLALNIAIGAYNEVYETSVPNETLFDITSDLAKAYFIAQKFLYVNDSRKREEIQDMRVVLYDKMLRMADAFWGDHSFNYGITKYKIANPKYMTKICKHRISACRVV